MCLSQFFLTTLEILVKAMKEGYVSLNNIKMIICGPPAVGKTAFKDLLLGETASKEYNSTPIARPIQVVQITASTGDEDEDKDKNVWEKVKNEDLLSMLSDALEEPSATSDIPSPAQEDALSQEENTTSADTTTSTPHQPVPTNNADTLQPASEATTTPQPTSEATTPTKVDKLLKKLLKQITDVKLKKLLKQITDVKKSKESQKLHEATWIHLLDSGGQPQFTDLLHMFVPDNSLYIIVMNLEATKSLGDKPKIIYSINGEKVSAQEEMTMTTLQIIENSVCSAIAAAPRDKASPKFVILATHIDKLSSKDLEVRLREYNDEIQKRLNKFCHHFIFYKSNKLIFPVNNLCDKNRHQEAAEIRKRLMSQSDKMIRPEEIPIRWYIFDILMKEEASKAEHGMISIDTCEAIGNKCAIAKNEMKDCLQYLGSMRLCIYYPEVLPNVVFTSPQFLIDCLSNIVRVSFVDDLQKILPKGASLSTEVIKSLKRDGVFDELLLGNLGLTFISGLFSESDLLKLLKHFNVISLIKTDNDVNVSHRYFMPILLPPERLPEKQKTKLGKTNDPLIIAFKGRIFPKVSCIYHFNSFYLNDRLYFQ